MYKLYQGIQWSWGWVENKNIKVDGIADVQLLEKTTSDLYAEQPGYCK